MLASLRRFCTRQRLFLSYASEDFKTAEEIAQLLTIDGHQVFFDKRSLKVSENYSARIRDSVNSADRFIFLISRNSLAPASYTLTELEFAQSRWPSPAGRIVPVLLDPKIGLEEAPVYLRTIQVLSPRGNVASEVVAAVDASTRPRPRCWAILAAAALLLAAGIGWSLNRPASTVDVALQPIGKVYFAPLRGPPPDQRAAGAPTEWRSSPVTVTLMPIVYNHRTDPGRRVPVLREQLDLQVGERTRSYEWKYIVEVTNKSCPDWLCVKGNVGQETLEPGRTSTPRETMFLRNSRDAITWQEFFDYVLSAQNPQIRIVLHYTLDMPSGTTSHEVTRGRECHIDVAEARTAFLDHGFEQGGPVLPPFMQSACLPARPAAK